MSQLFYRENPKAEHFIATTSYGNPSAGWSVSAQAAREHFARNYRQEYAVWYLLVGNCHVDDARNQVIADFLKTDSKTLVFIDADVVFQPEDLERLLMAHRSGGAMVTGGVYPYRRENEGEVLNMPVRMKPGVTEPNSHGLLPVEGLPTGFMAIRRDAIQAASMKGDWFVKDGQRIPILFERSIYRGGRLGGDIGFCMKVAEAYPEMEAPVVAIPELRLGHVATTTVFDSLGASLRRQKGETLFTVATKIKHGKGTLLDIMEAHRYLGNPWAADPDGIASAVGMARKAEGPILDVGSGLSTICMAAATTQTVWAIENDPVHAMRLRQIAAEAKVGNIALVTAPLKDGWYDISESDMKEMPKHFSLAFVDGPPRLLGRRMKFFESGFTFDRAIVDDVDDPEIRNPLSVFATKAGWRIIRRGRVAAMIPMEGAEDGDQQLRNPEIGYLRMAGE